VVFEQRLKVDELASRRNRSGRRYLLPEGPTLKLMHDELLGPLARELREISEGTREIPTTPARRHHYVAAFALAQFAQPRGDRKGFMAQLDVKTGTPGKTKPNDACFKRDLYAQEVDEGRNTTLEALLSIIERHSASALTRFVANPRAKRRRTVKRCRTTSGSSTCAVPSCSGSSGSSQKRSI
jgi:hypothetical protein